MDNSPLIFLDLDVSLMLADQVRVSQEEEARRFHTYLKRRYAYVYHGGFAPRVLKGTIHRVFNSFGRYWGDFWDEELSGKTTKFSFETSYGVVARRIILYEQEILDYDF